MDAPCSGGGITRYEDVPYSAEIVAGCAARQRTVIDEAAHLLCRGGYMLYSTCTFAREENEEIVKYICDKGFRTVDVPIGAGAERGIDMPDARRIYPMNFDGEGHFYCVLQKTAGETSERQSARKKRGAVNFGGLKLDVAEINGRTVLPIDVPVTDGLNVLRSGTAVFGEGKDASHALTHALTAEQARSFGTVELGEHAGDYIRGKQLDLSAPRRGMMIAAVCGHAIGLVKSAPSGDGTFALKNHYPKYLRV
ncbi:MAG: hypothetical protein K2L54_05765 [Clostridiales bacterium]|nr:hypothetical protein [Clostridiales bacterium]